MSATYAVITGATGGLGRTLTESFWHAGYSLHLVGRELGALHQLREGLSSRFGQTCMVAHCDLSVPAAVRALGEALSQGDIRVTGADFAALVAAINAETRFPFHARQLNPEELELNDRP